MMCSVLAFGTSKFVKLIKRGDTKIQVTEFVDFFDTDYRFDGGNQLKLAIRISDSDGNEVDFSDLLEL
jgi:predicted adenine nucleotide alpha hydrolase (AANH) superfamily ATPase